MLTYKDLKEKPTAFLAATGLKVDEFEKLVPVFAKRYEQKYPKEKTKAGKPRERRAGAGPKGKPKTVADKLLFILVYEKTYTIQTMQGLQFDMSQSQANYWIHELQAILQETLVEVGVTPLRDGEKVAEAETGSETAPDYVVDGTERRRQRPKDPKQQKESYSGKKKTHTDKNVLLVNRHSRKVVYLSPTVSGKKHDKKVVDENTISYPTGATLGKDTGFQGYEPDGVLTYQPKKKPKGKELSLADRWLNRSISSTRIIVENVIAGVKRCRIVKDTFRNTKEGFSDAAMEVACALHNFRIDCRQPLPDFHLKDFCT